MRMFTYGDVLRIALQSGHTTTCQDESRLTRHMPATTRPSGISSGMVINGQFEMFRGKDGRMVFVGQDGQYIRK